MGQLSVLQHCHFVQMAAEGGKTVKFTLSQWKIRWLNDKSRHNHLAQRACLGPIVATVLFWDDSLFPRPLICAALGGDDRQNIVLAFSFISPFFQSPLRRQTLLPLSFFLSSCCFYYFGSHVFIISSFIIPTSISLMFPIFIILFLYVSVWSFSFPSKRIW